MSFKDLAKNVTSMNPLMEGRERIKADEIMKKFPNGITITDFDMIQEKDKAPYPIIIFAEDDRYFHFGGTVLARVVDEWLGYYDSVEECREAFKAEGGVRITMSQGKTREGRDVTLVHVI